MILFTKIAVSLVFILVTAVYYIAIKAYNITNTETDRTAKIFTIIIWIVSYLWGVPYLIWLWLQ